LDEKDVKQRGRVACLNSSDKLNTSSEGNEILVFPVDFPTNLIMQQGGVLNLNQSLGIPERQQR
jgi:hypothetical protein